eukprot:tig00000219_g19448.t1
MAAPLQAEDTSKTKVFVGGLSWETTTDGLRQWAEQFGPLKEAVVIMDRNTGRSKGYGFVTFNTVEAAEKCCQNPTPTIEGRRANCNLAAIGAKQRTGPPGPGYGRGRGFQGTFPGGPGGYPQGFQQASVVLLDSSRPFPAAQFPGQQGPGGGGFAPGAQGGFQGGGQPNSFPQGQYAQHGGFQGQPNYNGAAAAPAGAGSNGANYQTGQAFPGQAGSPQAPQQQQQQFYAGGAR